MHKYQKFSNTTFQKNLESNAPEAPLLKSKILEKMPTIVALLQKWFIKSRFSIYFLQNNNHNANKTDYKKRVAKK